MVFSEFAKLFLRPTDRDRSVAQDQALVPLLQRAYPEFAFESNFDHLAPAILGLQDWLEVRDPDGYETYEAELPESVRCLCPDRKVQQATLAQVQAHMSAAISLLNEALELPQVETQRAKLIDTKHGVLKRAAALDVRFELGLDLLPEDHSQYIRLLQQTPEVREDELIVHPSGVTETIAALPQELQPALIFFFDLRGQILTNFQRLGKKEFARNFGKGWSPRESLIESLYRGYVAMEQLEGLRETGTLPQLQQDSFEAVKRKVLLQAYADSTQWFINWYQHLGREVDEHVLIEASRPLSVFIQQELVLVGYTQAVGEYYQGNEKKKK